MMFWCAKVRPDPGNVPWTNQRGGDTTLSTSPASQFIFESCGERYAPVYRVYRREDRVHMGFVEMDCAQEWVIRDLTFQLHDYVKGEGTRVYRTREWAAEALQEDFEAGKVAPDRRKHVARRSRTIWDLCETHSFLMEYPPGKRGDIVYMGGPARTTDACYPRRCVVKPGTDVFAAEHSDEELVEVIEGWTWNAPMDRLVEAVCALLAEPIDKAAIRKSLVAACEDSYQVPPVEPVFARETLSIGGVGSHENDARHLVADAAARAKYGIPDPK